MRLVREQSIKKKKKTRKTHAQWHHIGDRLAVWPWNEANGALRRHARLMPRAACVSEGELGKDESDGGLRCKRREYQTETQFTDLQCRRRSGTMS